MDKQFSGLHSELTDRVLKVFYSVAKELGFGFSESVYRKAMIFALLEEGFTAQEEVGIPVYFRGVLLGTYYADLIVDGLVILELKVADEIIKSFEAQLMHYLRSTQVEVGLVLAFGETAQFKRVILTNDRKVALVDQRT